MDKPIFDTHTPIVFLSDAGVMTMVSRDRVSTTVQIWDQDAKPNQKIQQGNLAIAKIKKNQADFAEEVVKMTSMYKDCKNTFSDRCKELRKLNQEVQDFNELHNEAIQSILLVLRTYEYKQKQVSCATLGKNETTEEARKAKCESDNDCMYRSVLEELGGGVTGYAKSWYRWLKFKVKLEEETTGKCYSKQFLKAELEKKSLESQHTVKLIVRKAVLERKIKGRTEDERKELQQIQNFLRPLEKDLDAIGNQMWEAAQYNYKISVIQKQIEECKDDSSCTESQRKRLEQDLVLMIKARDQLTESTGLWNWIKKYSKTAGIGLVGAILIVSVIYIYMNTQLFSSAAAPIVAGAQYLSSTAVSAGSAVSSVLGNWRDAFSLQSLSDIFCKAVVSVSSIVNWILRIVASLGFSGLAFSYFLPTYFAFFKDAAPDISNQNKKRLQQVGKAVTKTSAIVTPISYLCSYLQAGSDTVGSSASSSSSTSATEQSGQKLPQSDQAQNLGKVRNPSQDLRAGQNTTSETGPPRHEQNIFGSPSNSLSLDSSPSSPAIFSRAPSYPPSSPVVSSNPVLSDPSKIITITTPPPESSYERWQRHLQEARPRPEYLDIIRQESTA